MNENAPATFHPLREERLQRGWSQQELADRLGTTVVTIKRWERGTQQPSAYFRVKLCTLFDKSEEELGLRKDREQSEAAGAITEQQECAQESAGLPLAASPETTPPAQTCEEEQRSQDDLATKKEIPKAAASLSHTTPLFSKHAYFSARNKIWVLGIVLLLVLIGGSTLFFVYRPAHSQPGIHKPPASQKPLASLTPGTPLPVTGPIGIGNLRGTLTLDDSLVQQSKQNYWHAHIHCTFQEKGYHIHFEGASYCEEENRTFKDLAYQMDVKIEQGPQAGIIFRADADNHFYYFYVDVKGHFGLMLGHKTYHRILLTGTSKAIIQGYNQFNTLTVAAIGPIISLWINHQKVGQLKDTTIEQEGHIGVAGDTYDDKTETNITEALYRNAKVWENLTGA
jgi:transcriptional regulator with XRE-family HTH domain